MSGNNDVIKKSESALIAKKIFVEKMSFQRTEISNGNLRLSQSSISKSIQKMEDNQYKCSLGLRISDENDTATLELIISGLFELRKSLTEEQEQIIITKNTMAILFPYLRAQATLMTSQPDMEPVVLPVININALLQNLDN